MDNQIVETLNRDLESEVIPGLLLDPYHPANDQYLNDQRLLARKIVAHQATMRRSWVEITKEHFKGTPTKDIAIIVGVKPSTVTACLRREPTIYLLKLLRLYQMGIDGPRIEQRRAMLWRIAVKNEDEKPTVAKDCISELNRMEFSEEDRKLAANGNSNQIQVVINNDYMPRSTLDN